MFYKTTILITLFNEKHSICQKHRYTDKNILLNIYY